MKGPISEAKWARRFFYYSGRPFFFLGRQSYRLVKFELYIQGVSGKLAHSVPIFRYDRRRLHPICFAPVGNLRKLKNKPTFKDKNAGNKHRIKPRKGDGENLTLLGIVSRVLCPDGPAQIPDFGEPRADFFR